MAWCRWRLVGIPRQQIFEAFHVVVFDPDNEPGITTGPWTIASSRRSPGVMRRLRTQSKDSPKSFPARLEEIARGKNVRCKTGSIEVWFADEARVWPKKNKITRRWARRGTRPSAPSDQRTASTYIFGAICPKEGKAVGLILPKCNTEAMQLHLDEIAKDVAAGTPCRPASRSGGMAHVRQARCAG